MRYAFLQLEGILILLGSNSDVLCKSDKLETGISMIEVHKLVNASKQRYQLYHIAQ